VYEAEVVRDGKASDILISAKGKYLGTEKGEADAGQDKQDEGEEQKEK